MNQVEEIQIEIDFAKEMIAMRNACRQLHENKHFKEVILEGYFKTEAARLVMAKSNPNLEEAQQRGVDIMIGGIGALAQFFDMIERRGSQAEEGLRELEDTQDEIAQEELGI